MCSLFLFFLLGSIKTGRPTLAALIRGPGSIHAAGRMFAKVFLPFSGPSMASHRLVWMRRLVVRPLRHRADHTAPDGSLLWPVTPRSRGSERSEEGPVVKDSSRSSSFFWRTRGSLIEGPPPKFPSARSLTPQNDRCKELQGDRNGLYMDCF